MVDQPDAETRNAAKPALSPEDAALLETLTPELASLLYPDQSDESFTVTVCYPELAGSAAAEAKRLEAIAADASVSYQNVEAEPTLHCTTFDLRQIEEFHELYHLVETAVGAAEVDVLLNGRSVPLTRELWLPLLWSLRK